ASLYGGGSWWGMEASLWPWLGQPGVVPPVPPSAGPTGWNALHRPWSDAGATANLPLNWSGVNVAVGCVPPVAVAKLVVGRKPPWNQPQLSPAAFSRSPMFLPVMDAASRGAKSSW